MPAVRKLGSHNGVAQIGADLLNLLEAVNAHSAMVQFQPAFRSENSRFDLKPLHLGRTFFVV